MKKAHAATALFRQQEWQQRQKYRRKSAANQRNLRTTSNAINVARNEPSPQVNVLHQLKVKIFCGMHNPAGVYQLYHATLLCLMLIDCFAFNLMLDLVEQKSAKQNSIRRLIAGSHCTLLTILLLEMFLRLYAAACIQEYSGFLGIFRYLTEYRCARLYDTICIVILIGFMLLQHGIAMSRNLEQTFRILNFTLLFQFYRLFTKISKNFVSVVCENIRLILMSLTLYAFILTLLSYLVYFFEIDVNPSVNSLFDSVWFGFVSSTTIGYGDIVVSLPHTKLLTAFFVLCGYCMFTMPASIIGSAIAMRLQEKRQKILCLRPAANLLQKLWRFYAVHNIIDYWPRFVGVRANFATSANQNINLDPQLSSTTLNAATAQRKKKYVLLFLCKLSYLVAQKRFKYANLVHTTGSVPLQYVQLQRKIELINNAVRKHNSDIHRIHNQLKQVNKNLRETKRKLAQTKQFSKQNEGETLFKETRI